MFLNGAMAGMALSDYESPGESGTNGTGLVLADDNNTNESVNNIPDMPNEGLETGNDVANVNPTGFGEDPMGDNLREFDSEEKTKPEESPGFIIAGAIGVILLIYLLMRR